MRKPKRPDLKVHRLPRKALKPEDVGISIHIDLRELLEPAPPKPRVKLVKEKGPQCVRNHGPWAS